MKHEVRNPCSHGVKRENPEGVTDHRQVYNPCVIDSGICRTFGQGLYPCLGSVIPSVRGCTPAWGLSYLRSGVVPLPGVCRTFGQGLYPCLGSVVPSVRGCTPAWGLSYLRHYGLLWHVKQGLRATRSTACLGSVVPSGLPCRWGNSLPFREGLGVGFFWGGGRRGYFQPWEKKYEEI